MVIGPPPKIPFGFELVHTYVLSQVSLADPCTGSIAVTKIHNSGRCLFLYKYIITFILNHPILFDGERLLESTSTCYLSHLSFLAGRMKRI